MGNYIQYMKEEEFTNSKTLFRVDNTDNIKPLLLNTRHPFVSEFYLRTYQMKNKESMETYELIDKAKEIIALVDCLFMGYAKAESMFYQAEKIFPDFRYQWDNQADKYIRQLVEDIKKSE